MGNDISVVELRSMNNDQIHRFAALVNEPENTLANMSDDPVRIETYPGIGPQIISYRKIVRIDDNVLAALFSADTEETAEPDGRSLGYIPQLVFLAARKHHPNVMGIKGVLVRDGILEVLHLVYVPLRDTGGLLGQPGLHTLRGKLSTQRIG